MKNPLLDQLLGQLAGPLTGEALFDVLSDVVYFVKDAQCRYVLVNRTLAQRCGQNDPSALVGRTAAELFPSPLGKSYLEQDRKLLATGEPLLNELELHTYPGGECGWCLTTKLPLKNRQGRCVGLMGVSRDLYAPTDDYRDVAEALQQLQTRLDTPWTLEKLAQRAGLSAFRFDHRVRQLFHLSTSQLILKFRMDRATQYLRDTPRPIAQIALDCGYADHSAFTRQFRRTVGLTPAQYRKLHRG